MESRHSAGCGDDTYVKQVRSKSINDHYLCGATGASLANNSWPSSNIFCTEMGQIPQIAEILVSERSRINRPSPESTLVDEAVRIRRWGNEKVASSSPRRRSAPPDRKLETSLMWAVGITSKCLATLDTGGVRSHAGEHIDLLPLVNNAECRDCHAPSHCTSICV